jgi:exodeoxyribonuclease V alpha subunit
LILIGDVDQLPSVGPGNILKDVILAIEANTPPKPNTAAVTRLGYTFRQGTGSSIIHNAHLINQGQIPILDGDPDGDFFMFQVEDSAEAAATLVDLVAKRIPEKFNVRPEDIQVLSPMYRSALGVDALNLALQERLNPLNRQAEVTLAGRTYRVGDKVMQTKNNYNVMVYNGDVGVIQRIDPDSESIEVAMEEDVIEYSWGEIPQQLTLAYACSVHRSQGSEYPVVVMVVSTQHYLMLQRNLLYTGVTRAKKALIIVGTRRALHIAVNNNQVATRWSSLPWRIATAQFADYRK